MQVLILGATGSVGRHLLQQAPERGHHLTALLRDPSKLPEPGVRCVQGDALDPQAVERAVEGQDAVVFCLGRSNHRAPTTMFSDATRILIAAMEKHGVRRLIAITGIGAGDSKGHGGFFYDRVVYPLITRQTYLDKDRQEALIRASSLEWTILRPAPFTNGPRRGSVRAETNLKGVTMSAISRADVAAFVWDELETGRFRRQTPLIGY